MFKHAIFCSHGAGQRITGVEHTPLMLHKLFRRDINKIFVPDKENIFKNLISIYDANESVHGKRINIGGDHSMAIATGAHSLNKCRNTKFIWIDAHADINTINSSSSGNYHGMPLGFLTNQCRIKHLHFLRNRLNFDNLLYIGVRSIDPFEQVIIDKNNISVIRSQMCNRNVDIVCKYIEHFCRNSNVHVSFDVDAVDPYYIQSTGTTVKKGLTPKVVTKMLDFINKNTYVVNMDVCELNLDIGTTAQKHRSLEHMLNILKPLHIL
jgi:arginase